MFGFDIESRYDVSLFSANASFGVSPALKVELDVEDVKVTLSSSDGVVQDGSLGDVFTFSAPSGAIDPLSVTANYSLVGNLKVSAGLVFTGGIKLKAIGAEGKAFNLGIPALFPDSAHDADSDPDSYFWQDTLDLFQLEWFPDFASTTSSLRIDAGNDAYNINVGQTTDVVGPISNPGAAPNLSVSVLGAGVNSQRHYTVSEGDTGDKSVVFRIERAGDTAPTFWLTTVSRLATGWTRTTFPRVPSLRQEA